jgi:hypothetical protein
MIYTWLNIHTGRVVRVDSADHALQHIEELTGHKCVSCPPDFIFEMLPGGYVFGWELQGNDD